MHLIPHHFPFYVLLGAHALCSQAQTDYPPPKTKNEYLSRSAGAYLGSIEYLRALKNSPECENALTSITVPEYENVIKSELLAGFSESERADVQYMFYTFKEGITQEAHLQASRMLNATLKENSSSNTVRRCEMLSVLMNQIIVKAKDNWLSTLIKYGNR